MFLPVNYFLYGGKMKTANVYAHIQIWEENNYEILT